MPMQQALLRVSLFAIALLIAIGAPSARGDEKPASRNVIAEIARSEPGADASSILKLLKLRPGVRLRFASFDKGSSLRYPFVVGEIPGEREPVPLAPDTAGRFFDGIKGGEEEIELIKLFHHGTVIPGPDAYERAALAVSKLGHEPARAGLPTHYGLSHELAPNADTVRFLLYEREGNSDAIRSYVYHFRYGENGELEDLTVDCETWIAGPPKSRQYSLSGRTEEEIAVEIIRDREAARAFDEAIRTALEGEPQAR